MITRRPDGLTAYRADDTPEPCTDESRAAGCTCSIRIAGTEFAPPYTITDQWCELHGRDPDYERELRAEAWLERDLLDRDDYDPTDYDR